MLNTSTGAVDSPCILLKSARKSVKSIFPKPNQSVVVDVVVDVVVIRSSAASALNLLHSDRIDSGIEHLADLYKAFSKHPR